MVTVYLRDPATGTLEMDSRVTLGSDLGGFEAWRWRVWGSDALRRRGASFLPQLATRDLYVEAEELPAFLLECRQLRGAVADVGRDLGHDDEGEAIGHRLRNFIDAAELADPLRGVVVIG